MTLHKAREPEVAPRQLRASPARWVEPLGLISLLLMPQTGSNSKDVGEVGQWFRMKQGWMKAKANPIFLPPLREILVERSSDSAPRPGSAPVAPSLLDSVSSKPP